MLNVVIIIIIIIWNETPFLSPYYDPGLFSSWFDYVGNYWSWKLNWIET